MPVVDQSAITRVNNPEGSGTRADTWRTTVTVGGKLFGVWDKQTGGEVDSEEFKYKPGGMAPEISLGGSKTTGNLTISRLYKLGRDHQRLQELINGVGKAVVVITKQPLDQDGNAWGSPITYRGTLKRVQAPEVDSTSSDPGMIEIEVTPDGFPVVHA